MLGAMYQILRAAGLDPHHAEEHDIHGEPVVLVHLTGDAERLRSSARAALPGHYPVLVLDPELVTEPDQHHRAAPADILARAASTDVDTRMAEMSGRRHSHPELLGTGDEGYHLDGYDVARFGEPATLVILPRPEPWAAFAYLDPYGGWSGLDPEFLVAAAHRWHDRYGAEPTVIGLATGFTVPRPPTGRADAERLAAEHVAVAGLTARTTQRAYARALTQLDRWCLYDRP